MNYPNILPDGVYFSNVKPELSTTLPYLGPHDYVARPYNTVTYIIWRNEKPILLDYEGQANYGAALTVLTPAKGYITICMEND